MGDAESDELIGRTLGKKFLVRRRLGAGGMGVVYEAEHLITKRVGALKLLHPSVAENARIVARFLREASAAGRIADPHIVETIDAGELTDGEPYIFMELLEGLPLSELIQRRGRLSCAESRAIALQAAAGLAAAHAAGIVHRDVKPANLFLCRGEPERVKLLDFGISKFGAGSEHQLTAEGAPLGTPYYMSPEQVAGKTDVGPVSDIYSLGVVLYECVTGKVPFDAETLPALSIKIFEGSYAPPSSLSESLVAGFDDVIARAMATVPSKRYASMSEFRAALEALDPDAPISLDETLSAAPSSGCASRERPMQARLAPAGTDSSGPPPVSSVVSTSRPKWWPWTLAGLTLGGAFLLSRSPPAPPAAGPVEPLAATEAPAPGRPTVVAPVMAPPPPATAQASPAPSGRPRRGTSAARASDSSVRPPISKAARDGLSEQNPFE